MAYNKTNWQDTLRDPQGNVIQKGTPLNAQALGKIEEGIVQTEQKIDTEIGKVTAQLAQTATRTEVTSAVSPKADKTYVDTKITAVASGSPKGTYATVTDLQTAFPTGTTGIYVVSGDGKWYYWNGTAWTAGGVYQSLGIAEGSVSAKHTNFLEKSTKNIFDYQDLSDDTYVFPTNGTSSKSLDYAFKVTKHIAIEPLSNYVSNMRVRSLAFYNSAKVFISGISTIIESNTAFLTPANAAYMRLNIYSANDVTKGQIEKGSIPTSFEPFYFMRSFIPPNSITARELASDVMQTQISKWKGKTFVSLGTSIVWYDGKTYPDGTLCRGYQTHLKEQLGFASYLNKGVSGSSMANGTANGDGTNKTGKTVDYTQFDLVTIEAGSNDYKLNVPLGNRGLIADTNFDTNTFYGAYRDLLQYILSIKPTIRIVLLTPPRRKQSGYTDEGLNEQGLKMYEYVLAVKDIAEMYGLPIVDQWHESGFTYYNATTYTIDGVHPNNLGYERLGHLAVGRIKDL